MRGIKVFCLIITIAAALMLSCSDIFAAGLFNQGENTFKLKNGLDVELLGIVRDTEDKSIQDFIVTLFLVTAKEDSNLKVAAYSVFNNIGHEFEKVAALSIAGHGVQHEIIGEVPTLVWIVHYVPISYGKLPAFSRMTYKFNDEDLQLRRQKSQSWEDMKNSGNEILQEWLNIYPTLAALIDNGEKVSSIMLPNNSPENAALYNSKVFNGHHYKAFNNGNAISGEEAQRKCESMGGHLAVITSREEQNFIRENFNMSYEYLIGGFASGSKWQWVTGEAWEYSNWAPSEPRNGDGNYLAIWGNSGGRWGNFTGLQRYICEWEF